MAAKRRTRHKAAGSIHQPGFNHGWTRIPPDDSGALPRAGRSSVASVTSCRVGLGFIRVIREVCGRQSAAFATAFGRRGFSMVRGGRPRLHEMPFGRKTRTDFRQHTRAVSPRVFTRRNLGEGGGHHLSFVAFVPFVVARSSVFPAFLFTSALPEPFRGQPG